eukprot:jgi/Undpi1/8744/HiC_scaffold_25.g11206.m1
MPLEEEDASLKNTWWDRLRALRQIGKKPELEQPEPVIARGSSAGVMTVVQFRPAWEMQAYLRFARLPYRVENSRYAGSAASGLYPALMDGNFVLPGENATLHVSRRRINLDAKLSEGEKANSLVTSYLVRGGLQPLLRVLRYSASDSEVSQTVHPPMKKTLPWLLSTWTPSAEARRSRVEASVRGLEGMDKSELVALARTRYASLDLMLGLRGGGVGGGGGDADEGHSNTYFFGAIPTSLDAVVFGHLAEAWTIEALLDVLPEYKNLSRFFRQVCDEYFSPGWSPPPALTKVDGGGVSESKAGSGEMGGTGDGEGCVGDDELREAMMHANYVNSLNAFNQLPGTPAAAAAAAATPAASGAGKSEEAKGDDFLPLKYTAVSVAMFALLS